MRFGRFAAAALAVVLTAAAMPFPAYAKDRNVKHIVVLGDGISSGAGLAEGELSYAEQLAGYLGAEIISFAEDNYTTDDVLQCLEQSEVKSALADADMILVSAGMNDMMIPYIELAESYIAEFELSSFSELYDTSKAELGLTDDEMMTRSSALSAAARKNKSSAVGNIAAIGQNLSQYQNAQVIYLNVYNPMDILENYNSLSANRQLAYDMGVLRPLKGVVNDSNGFNPAYAALATDDSCIVVNTYGLFAGQAYLYANPSELGYQLNADGQSLLALETAKTAGVFRMGDVNGDGDIAPSDASGILVHITAEATQNTEAMFNPLQRAAADLSGNGEIDTADASAVLLHIAQEGAGEKNG